MKYKLMITIFAVLSLMFLGLVPWIAKSQEIAWKTNPTPLPNPIYNHVSFVHNDRIYIASGAVDWLEDWVEIPDVLFAETNPDGTISSWIETTPLPQNRTHTKVVVWQDYVYVIGGYCSMFTEPTEREDEMIFARSVSGPGENVLSLPDVVDPRCSRKTSSCRCTWTRSPSRKPRASPNDLGRISSLLFENLTVTICRTPFE